MNEARRLVVGVFTSPPCKGPQRPIRRWGAFQGRTEAKTAARGLAASRAERSIRRGGGRGGTD